MRNSLNRGTLNGFTLQLHSRTCISTHHTVDSISYTYSGVFSSYYKNIILAPHSLQAVRVRARSLYIRFTFTAHSLYILINWALAVYSLHNHIHCIFTITACSLQVHFTAHSLHMHCILAYSLLRMLFQ